MSTVNLIEYAQASDEMLGELMAVIGMASETNRLAIGWRVPLDAALR